LTRFSRYAAAKKEAKAKGETVVLKRLPVAPREARTVSTSNNLPPRRST
jgi:large subunit ribosomal protein L21e